MAKYNATYEGRLPHGICNKVICDNKLVVNHKLTDNLLAFIKKIHKRITDFLC